MWYYSHDDFTGIITLNLMQFVKTESNFFTDRYILTFKVMVKYDRVLSYLKISALK